MTPSVARFLAQKYPAAYIREKLAMTQGLLAAGSELVAKNPVGWLRRAIEENYQPPRNKVLPTPAPRRKSQRSTRILEKNQQEQNSIITPPVELPQPDSQTQQVWEQAVEHLRHNLAAGETADRLTDTMLLEVTETKALIFVPNRFAIPWIERRLYGQIQNAMKNVLERDVDLLFVTSPL